MPEICYLKNYLQEVIARIDFAVPIEALNAAVLPDKVQKALKSRYPIFESTKAFSQNVIIHEQGVHTNSREFQQWVYHGENREKTITVTPDSITVSIKQYRDYEEFKLDVIEPIDEISKIEGNIFINRTGLRYVNVFPNITNKYDELIEKFHPMIASPFKSIIDIKNLSRIINISEYIHDEVKCRLQSGIFNPDYPAKIKKREFILDFDAFIDTPHSFTNINELFDSLHNVIQSKFEDSITTKLRDELNEE
jgi:uncharacterized protein (TIGR04255 family)